MRVKNEYILQHEQSHFDISELFARMLNKAMKEYKYNESTAGKDMNNIYQRIMTEHQQMQDEYDSESNFSRNKAGQEKWNKKITNALKEYKDYANY